MSAIWQTIVAALDKRDARMQLARRRARQQAWGQRNPEKAALMAVQRAQDLGQEHPYG